MGNRKVRAPQPTSQLNQQQKSFYKKVCDFLAEHDKLRPVDAPIITQTVLVKSLVDRAYLELSSKGLVAEYTNGNTGLSSELNAYTKLLGLYKDLASQLGLSPYIREKMRFESVKKPNSNPFAKPKSGLKKVS